MIFPGISGTPTLRSKEIEGQAAEVVLAQQRAFFPGCLNENLDQVFTGYFTFLAVLEAGDAWVRHHCMEDHAKEEEGHFHPLCVQWTLSTQTEVFFEG